MYNLQMLFKLCYVLKKSMAGNIHTSYKFLYDLNIYKYLIRICLLAFAPGFTTFVHVWDSRVLFESN